MEASEAGLGELRSDGIEREDDEVFVGVAPEVRFRSHVYVTHGAQGSGEPCGKCGCAFVNVVCPQLWPIDTVALTCAKCGSIVEYIDGLLLLSVKQAIREHYGRSSTSQIAGNRPEYEPSGLSGLGVAKELVQMGIDGGLSDQDIAEAMEVTEDYVALIAGMLR